MAIVRFLGDKIVCLSTDTFPDTLDGATLLTIDSLREYIRYNGSWVLMSGSQMSSGFSTIFREDYSVTSPITSGTPITIPNSRYYASGLNRLQVGLNGVLQQRHWALTGADYREMSTTSVAFSYALPTGSVVNFTIFSKDPTVTS